LLDFTTAEILRGVYPERTAGFPRFLGSDGPHRGPEIGLRFAQNDSLAGWRITETTGSDAPARQCHQQAREAYNAPVFEFKNEIPAQRMLGGSPKSKDGTVRHVIEFVARVALLAFIVFVLWWASSAPLSSVINLFIIVGGVLLTLPLVWLGRKILDRHQTTSGVAWTTTFVHFALGLTLGVPIVRAIGTHQNWSGLILPVPSGIGLALVIITGAAFLLTVVNLALKGLGAPFFISLSQKLAADWSYAWTRNPMVLAVLAFLLSLGIWFQSMLFLFWVLILFAPALLVFVKVYEERELEIRFGASYLEYKSRTPMLFPRRPKG